MLLQEMLSSPETCLSNEPIIAHNADFIGSW